MTKVYIDGAVGTTGLRIRERLSSRSDVELLIIPEEYRKDINYRKEYVNRSDVTFLCLPDSASIEAIKLAEDSVKIIDASTAHRTNPNWAYGFPELGKDFYDKIKNGNRIANPGCHASGFIALIYPLIKSGVLDEDTYLTCTSLTGYSGGGKKMIADYEDANRDELLDAPRVYGLNQSHKHLPEMCYVTGLKRAPSFTPIVGDFYSGMQVIVPIELNMLKGIDSLKSLQELYKDFYNDKKLVRAVDFNESFISTKLLSGKDVMEVTVCGNEERVNLISLFDNLGKGASGAAIQNFNIISGVDETKGLEL
ncbi:MAG: N-acetyl-gamma-glutamyl-phosphate reductase [Clostridia bacterium]|nr:N-acetyl-gamma-glutamyl-phosphate reductase [Clostridia bacterium]